MILSHRTPEPLLQGNQALRKTLHSPLTCPSEFRTCDEAFGKNKEDYRAIGTFLVFTADKKEGLSNSEYSKATREVDDVAIGRYEQAQKRGNSMKL